MLPLVNSGPHAIQAMPFKKGYVGLESGDIAGQRIIYCTDAGDITINYEDGTDVDTTMETGEARSITEDIASITITTGTYDFA